MSTLNALWAELRRRNVLKAGGAYVAGGWVFFQLADTLLPLVGTPDWVLQALMILLILGLPFVLAFSWAFELTPEGLMRTEEVDPAASQTRATGRKIQYLLVGLLVVAIAASVMDPFGVETPPGTRTAGTVPATFALPEDVRAMAVMPFTTSGPDTDVWQEGMMGVLTTNLDGMGTLRAIDKRTVLARLREHGGASGEADLETTMAAARAAQASMALVGDVVSTGTTVRITAAVHDTQTGDVLRRLQVEGPEADFLRLVDRLTVQAVEAAQATDENGGSALPLPNVSALTTESLPALRAYLGGERHVRRSDVRAALRAFEQAVRLDSTFAMAQLRLAQIYPLAPSSASFDALFDAQAQARTHLRAARRHGERLPPRETALLESAVTSQLEGDAPQAARILQDATRRFPTDPELWYAYAGAIWNPVVAWRVGAGTEGDVASAPADASRMALALDSTMTPAYFELTAATIARGDTAEARRLLRAYRRHAPAGEGERFAFTSLEAGLDLAYGDSTAQADVLRRFREDTFASGGAYLAGTLSRDATAEALRALEQLGEILIERNGFYSLRTLAQFSRGRYARLRAFVQDTTQASTSVQSARLRTAARLLGRGAIQPTAVPAGLGQDLCRMSVAPTYRLPGCYYTARRAEYQAAGGAPATAARRLLRESAAALAKAGEADLAGVARGFLAALDGLQMLAQGRPAAHDTLDAAHVRLAPLYGGLAILEPMEAQARALIGGSDPARALPYARMIAVQDPYGHYLAGRAHEAAGDIDAARSAYDRFVSAWRDADPDVPALQYANAVLDGASPPEAPPL